MEGVVSGCQHFLHLPVERWKGRLEETNQKKKQPQRPIPHFTFSCLPLSPSLAPAALNTLQSQPVGTPGPFSPRSSSPSGKESTGTVGLFGEAPFSSDFHGKRAVIPRRHHPAPQAPAVPQIPMRPKRCSARAHPRMGMGMARIPRAPFCALEEPQAPSPLSGPPPAKALSDLGVRTVDRHMASVVVIIYSTISPLRLSAV